MSAIKWQGDSYDRISAPQAAWGADVLQRLELSGAETVIDAGCGSGRVTEMLLERLPRGQVIAVDASESMIAAARERLRGRAELRLGDLLDLEVAKPVDAVVSTATFHWISDHERLFTRLRAALRPGGRLVAQCGGEGNLTALRARAAQILAREPFASSFAGWRAPWNYAAPDQTHKRLLDAGFSSARCRLTPAPVAPEHPREYLATIVLAPHVQRLPGELREAFLDEMLAAEGRPTLDYVRLDIDAIA